MSLLRTRARRARRSMRNKYAIKFTSIQHKLVIFRSVKHIYAQVVDTSGTVVAAASTLEKDFTDAKTYNCAAAVIVGKKIGNILQDKKIDQVVLYRRSYMYHGKVKALCESIKECGIKI